MIFIFLSIGINTIPVIESILEESAHASAALKSSLESKPNLLEIESQLKSSAESHELKSSADGLSQSSSSSNGLSQSSALLSLVKNRKSGLLVSTSPKRVKTKVGISDLHHGNSDPPLPKMILHVSPVDGEITHMETIHKQKFD